MQLRHPERSRASDDNMIPMINIVFLLLIFFMVAGTIRPPDALEVAPPESSSTTSPAADHRLYFNAGGSLVLDGKSLTRAQLRGAIEALNDNPDTTVVTLALQADAGVTVATLRPLFDELRAAGLTEVELITARPPAPSR